MADISARIEVGVELKTAGRTTKAAAPSDAFSPAAGTISRCVARRHPFKPNPEKFALKLYRLLYLCKKPMRLPKC